MSMDAKRDILARADGFASTDSLDEATLLDFSSSLHILGSGQGASSTAEMFSVSLDFIAAFAAGKLHVQIREAPLADIEREWSAQPERSVRGRLTSPGHGHARRTITSAWRWATSSNRSGCTHAAKISTDSTSRGPGRLKKALPSVT
jgi:hypothetical protein